MTICFTAYYDTQLHKLFVSLLHVIDTFYWDILLTVTQSVTCHMG